MDATLVLLLQTSITLMLIMPLKLVLVYRAMEPMQPILALITSTMLLPCSMPMNNLLLKSKQMKMQSLQGIPDYKTNSMQHKQELA